MEAIVKQYENIIDKIYEDCQKYENYDKETQKAVLDAYETKGTVYISKLNHSLKVIMDNDFAKAIIKKANASLNKYVNDFKKLEGTIAFLTYLTKIVDTKKFITKRESKKIELTFKQIKAKKQYKLNSRMKVLEKSDGK